MTIMALVLAAVSLAEAQRVTAMWDANTDPHTIGYRIYIGTSPGDYQADIDVGNATSYPVDLPPGGSYYFVVRAYNQAGQLGPASNQATFGAPAALPPGAPAGLHAGVSGSRVTLGWSAPSAGGQPTGYALFAGTSPGGTNLVNQLVLGPGLSVAGEIPPGTYYARLVAFNGAGASPFSSEVSFSVGGSGGTLPPGQPVGFSASMQGAAVTLSWSPPVTDGGTGPASSYVVEAGTAPGLSNLGVFNVGSATSFSSPPIPPGVYYVRVRAVNARGLGAPSAEVVVRYGTPGRPRSLAASGQGTVVLTWRAPSSGGAAGYVVEAGSAPGLANLAAIPVGNVLRVETVAPPGTYYVRIRAINGAGAGEASNEVVVRR